MYITFLRKIPSTMFRKTNIYNVKSMKFCTKVNSEKSRYSNTVLLPKTKLPLRLDGQKLIERDKLLSNSDQLRKLYKWQRIHLTSNEFILHDGPPYANGLLHMGHAINKILKDVVLRNNILQGNKVHYVPGWDCHGLPIELKATSNINELDCLSIRKKARNFASETLMKQKEGFISWGVTGDWDNAYSTYHPDYIKNQLNIFYKLYLKGLVYRDVKPVYWSPSTKTALAEAELEYNPNHRSTAVMIKLQIQHGPNNLGMEKQVYGLIWTTTPWTLPSNQAVCYNPTLSYSIVRNPTNDEFYIVATNLIQEISKKLKSNLEEMKTFEGDALKNITYVHPIYKDKILNFLPADHALETKGTGLVHTAPAHGPEDYLVALENNISVKCMVDENGSFTSEVGLGLEGLSVLSDGTTSVLNILGNDVIHIEDYIHSYPYDWRTKKPVILRASKQWFIDTNFIKQKCADLLNNINFLPDVHAEVYKHHFKTQLQKRPYWCISRQRSWGVPIPVFYSKDTDKAIINEYTIKTICDFVDKNGCDFWWKLDVNDMLQETASEKYNINVDNLKKGEDILDIWFDSGLSWSYVLSDKQVADLYLEGVDQFTGWFQSSLLTSVALREEAPYKSLYIHGFAVDQNGKKMSKSIGNVVNPTDILTGTKGYKPFGIDTLRWWVACHASRDATAAVSMTVLKASSEEVQKIRSVLRFTVAALYDYENIMMDYSELKLIDKYMLHLISCYQKEAEDYMKNYQYHKVRALVIQFVTNKVSALYYTSIKDRLYCDSKDSLNRRAAQYVLNIILQIITRTIAPILPHLAEELHSHIAFKEVDSFFKTSKLGVPKQWYSEDVSDMVDYILQFKKEINKKADGNTISKSVLLLMNTKQFQTLKANISKENISFELSDIFQVANVDILEDNSIKDEEYEINITNTNRCNCPRCRRFVSESIDQLCYRCSSIVNDTKMCAMN